MSNVTLNEHKLADSRMQLHLLKILKEVKQFLHRLNMAGKYIKTREI